MMPRKHVWLPVLCYAAFFFSLLPSVLLTCSVPKPVSMVTFGMASILACEGPWGLLLVMFAKFPRLGRSACEIRDVSWEARSQRSWRWVV